MSTHTDNHLHQHVAILAFPFGTHAAPLLATVRRISALSPPTAIFSFFSTPNSNRSLGFPPNDIDSNTDKIRVRDVSNGVPEGYVFSGNLQEEIDLFLKAAPESFRTEIKAAEAETGRRVTCLLTDSFLWFGGEMAEEMGVPWVTFWVGVATSLSAHLHTDLIKQNLIGGDLEMDRTLEFIPGMSEVRTRDLPEGIVFGNMGSVFSEMLHRMGRALPATAAVFFHSFEEIEPVVTRDLKSKLRNVLCVGPPNLMKIRSSPTDATGCLEWLDTQSAASVVYIGFGSVLVPARGELAAMAEALEESGAPFIWSLKREGDLPEGFVERTRERGQGMVVSWAPQAGILGHAAAGVYVTHCGWSSLLESIAAGVPMICRPFFGDQRINTRLVETLGVGIGIGAELSKEGLVRNLGAIVRGAEGTKMRDKILLVRDSVCPPLDPKGLALATSMSCATSSCPRQVERNVPSPIPSHPNRR